MNVETKLYSRYIDQNCAAINLAKFVTKDIFLNVEHVSFSSESEELVAEQPINSTGTEIIFCRHLFLEENGNSQKKWTSKLVMFSDRSRSQFVAGFMERPKFDSQIPENSTRDRLITH